MLSKRDKLLGLNRGAVWSSEDIEAVRAWYALRQCEREPMAALAKRLRRTVKGIRWLAYTQRLSQRIMGRNLGPKVRKYHGEGFSNLSIGRILLVDESCVRKWLKRLGLQTNFARNRPCREVS